MTKFLIFLVHLYQKLEPARVSLYSSIGIPVNSCKYQTTCSDYTIQSIKRYGTIKGLWMALKRLSSCH